MDKVANDHSCLEERLARVLSALGTGAILLDSNCEIAWMDERTRARLNGGIEQLAATLRGSILTSAFTAVSMSRK